MPTPGCLLHEHRNGKFVLQVTGTELWAALGGRTGPRAPGYRALKSLSLPERRCTLPALFYGQGPVAVQLDFMLEGSSGGFSVRRSNIGSMHLARLAIG